MIGLKAITSKQTAHDLDPPYLQSESLSLHVHSRWAHWKDLGNEAFKAKDLTNAALLYLTSLYIADGTGSGYRRILLQGFKFETAIHKAVASEDIHRRILGFISCTSLGMKRLDLPSGQGGTTSYTYYVPNLPAAIVHSNLAHTFLQMAGAKGDGEEPGPTTPMERAMYGTSSTDDRNWAQLALAHATRAVTICGEYEKGHHRLKLCYERLGMTKLARKKQKQLADFTMLLANGMVA